MGAGAYAALASKAEVFLPHFTSFLSRAQEPKVLDAYFFSELDISDSPELARECGEIEEVVNVW